MKLAKALMVGVAAAGITFSYIGCGNKAENARLGYIKQHSTASDLFFCLRQNL